APTTFYPLSLHDALPILAAIEAEWETAKPPASFTIIGFPDQEMEKTHFALKVPWVMGLIATRSVDTPVVGLRNLKAEHETRIIRSEEHTSELQSRFDLVC